MIPARLSICPLLMWLNPLSCTLGRTAISNGKREANGANAKKCSFSATKRFRCLVPAGAHRSRGNVPSTQSIRARS